MLGLAKVEAGRDGLALGEYPIREPGAHEVLIKVLVSGVCGTDMQIYHGQGAFGERVKLPTILGHEMCGRVEAVGEAVSRTQAGDLVSLESHVPCGECRSCRTGRSHVCAATRYPGIDFNGCFAEYVTVPESIVWVNPADVDPERAALLEPLGIAVHATLEGQGVAGRTVVVNGCGPIGLMNVAVARHYGAASIVAVDVNPYRLGIARQMGADLAVNAAEKDVVSTVRRHFGGEGAEVVFEYTGSAAGARNTFQLVAPLGEVKWCATPAGPIEFDFGLWRRGRPTIHNIHGRRLWDTWYACAPLVYEGALDLAPIASHRVPLREGREAFELILAGQAVKPLILCD
ncbi:alcohol dehydrogenase catalytic domain-containing protein [Alkalilimnicola sp. S0819]|uniref:alcohol dehydrogenase catalytic domain-containing protein n=1 Tax=Alkalilimnicola sp. S0819 TaxID=2613922 RepID=UPI001262A58A|nr:alcohol dehydrogenase catalytic domain-containing protein [Alkalilimnicola sp. S0819]KAB7624082.1 alcohol dehydrogenase catalytic domain-containing protein [Alkalilimnicola sp. S0819]MPQ16332.1 alcohol dehydrogenase catalytic domain-containing protein [Alkalilimnicola sp. S0819]